MSVMNLACVLAGSYNALLVCRIVQGIGVGGEMPVAAAYINELSRAQGRGRFFLLYETIFPLGLMAAGQIGAWLVPIFGWKIMFLIGGIPGLFITGMVARLPESPRWLISQGRLEDAEKIIGRIESSVSGGVRATLPAGTCPTVPLLRSTGANARARTMERGTLRRVSRPHHGGVGIVGVLVFRFQRLEQLDAESLQHRLSSAASAIAARRLDDERGASGAAVDLRAGYRSRGPQELDGVGVSRERRSSRASRLRCRPKRDGRDDSCDGELRRRWIGQRGPVSVHA